MSRIRFAFLLFCLLLGLAGCDDSQPSTAPRTASPSDNDATIVPVTPIDKPAGVPDNASRVVESEALGQITRTGGETPEGVRTRRIESLMCSDGLMTIETDEETIYAAISCDRVPHGDQLAPFLETEAAIELELTNERSRVLIETLAGSQAEFTVSGIWVE